MTKALLALGAAVVALTAVPAGARNNVNQASCARSQHGRCVAWNRMNRVQAMRSGYGVGHRFGPDYSYTDYSALPQPYVTRYHLAQNYRYVYNGNRIYVVDPTTYAVRRVINAVTR
jgi:hypothetical protein